MNGFSAAIHNGILVGEAEKSLNALIELDNEEHYCKVYLKNPDGTTIALQKGFQFIFCEECGFTKARESK